MRPFGDWEERRSQTGSGRHPSRRAVLVTLAAVGLAGCLDTEDEPESTPELTPEDTAADDEPPAEESADDSVNGDTSDDEQGADESGADEPPTDGSTADDPTAEESTPTPPDGTDDSAVFPGYEMTNVAVRTADDTLLGWVRAAVADTNTLRHTGLSETDSMPEHYGMVFVYEEVDDRTFVMRDMDFGIDIVYADDEGRITTIHHAPEPGPGEDGSQQRYPGRGQYVLEVNYGWTTERGVEEGDIIVLEETA